MTKQLLFITSWILLISASISAQTLTYQSKVTLSTDAIYSGHRAMSWGDITGAGQLDIVGETNSPDYKYLGVLNDLTGTPVFTSQDHLDQEDKSFYGSCVGDLDSDGDLDLITAGSNGSTTSPNNVYNWDATALRYEKVGSAYSIDGEAFYGKSSVIGDFTNDSKDDVVWIATTAAYLGVNSTTTADDITFSSISSVASISTTQGGADGSDTGDFNADGNLDVILSDCSYNSGDYGGYYQLLLGNGDGTFAVSSVDLGSDSKRGYTVAAADVNKDGVSDFVLNRSCFSSAVGYSSNIILYTRNVDNTGFDETIVYTSTSTYCRAVALEDIDNDTYPDLLFQSQGGSYMTIYLNNGDGTFNETADLTFSTGSTRDQFFLYDLDNSGYNEIVTLDVSNVSYYKVGYEPEAPTAGDQTYTYDGTEKSASATAPESSTLVWYTTESGSTTTTEPTATASGTYTAYAAAIDDDSGFESERTLVTLTIDAIELSVSGCVANSKEYDGSTSAVLTGGSLVGVLDGEDVSLADYATGTFASVDVSSGITVTSTMTLSGEHVDDYTLIQPSLTADITQVELTVTADDQTMIVGNEIPTLTISYAGFVNDESENILDDEPEASTAATSTSEAGGYGITVSGGSDTNYSFSYVSGILTVSEDRATVIDELSTESISVYPNPATTNINIEGSESVAYLYNLSGNIVLSHDLSQTSSISISDLTNGIYLLKVDGEVIKVVKK